MQKLTRAEIMRRAAAEMEHREYCKKFLHSDAEAEKAGQHFALSRVKHCEKALKQSGSSKSIYDFAVFRDITELWQLSHVYLFMSLLCESRYARTSASLQHATMEYFLQEMLPTLMSYTQDMQEHLYEHTKTLMTLGCYPDEAVNILAYFIHDPNQIKQIDRCIQGLKENHYSPSELLAALYDNPHLFTSPSPTENSTFFSAHAMSEQSAANPCHHTTAMNLADGSLQPQATTEAVVVSSVALSKDQVFCAFSEEFLIELANLGLGDQIEPLILSTFKCVTTYQIPLIDIVNLFRDFPLNHVQKPRFVQLIECLHQLANNHQILFVQLKFNQDGIHQLLKDFKCGLIKILIEQHQFFIQHGVVASELLRLLHRRATSEKINLLIEYAKKLLSPESPLHFRDLVKIFIGKARHGVYTLNEIFEVLFSKQSVWLAFLNGCSSNKFLYQKTFNELQQAGRSSALQLSAFIDNLSKTNMADKIDPTTSDRPEDESASEVPESLETPVSNRIILPRPIARRSVIKDVAESRSAFQLKSIAAAAAPITAFKPAEKKVSCPSSAFSPLRDMTQLLDTAEASAMQGSSYHSLKIQKKSLPQSSHVSQQSLQQMSADDEAMLGHRSTPIRPSQRSSQYPTLSSPTASPAPSKIRYHTIRQSDAAVPDSQHTDTSEHKPQLQSRFSDSRFEQMTPAVTSSSSAAPFAPQPPYPFATNFSYVAPPAPYSYYYMPYAPAQPPHPYYMGAHTYPTMQSMHPSCMYMPGPAHDMTFFPAYGHHHHPYYDPYYGSYAPQSVQDPRFAQHAAIEENENREIVEETARSTASAAARCTAPSALFSSHRRPPNPMTQGASCQTEGTLDSPSVKQSGYTADVDTANKIAKKYDLWASRPRTGTKKRDANALGNSDAVDAKSRHHKRHRS